ncbi:hypothetical protein HanXRQr2_Chr15g0709251 [Helianthus annuus]|uniref:Uncharacterized protein n=1 Tax=Helianthus annuus TaxID=4232 RepID=A0A9K3E4H3_HELAN|nr:hypothetical protein HanXRQr2_Chr15g0709251 [Helianthus annuus]
MVVMLMIRLADEMKCLRKKVVLNWRIVKKKSIWLQLHQMSLFSSMMSLLCIWILHLYDRNEIGVWCF